MTKMMAKKYLAAGFVVFPVGLSYNKEKSTDRKVKKDVAPEPGFTKLTLQAAKRLSFTKNAIGLLTGFGVMALDIDNTQLWDHILSELGESEPETCRCISQSGGHHLLFKVTPELERLRRHGVFGFKKLGRDDFDVLGKGDFLLVPPSSFMMPLEKREYTFVEGYSLLDNPEKLIEAPEWLLQVLTPGSVPHSRVRGSFLRQDLAKKAAERERVEKEENEEKEQEVKEEQGQKRKGGGSGGWISREDTGSPAKRARSASVSSDKGYTAAEEALIALDTQDRLKEVTKHVKKLNANRAVDRQSWIEVGMAIHHATDGQGMELWDEFSRRAGPYDRRVLEYQWDSFKHGSGITMGSLIHWAKEDAKEAREEKKRLKVEETKMKADEALRREAVKFGVNHTGGKGVFEGWDAEKSVAVIKNTMHHPDHRVECVFSSNGAFQRCLECEWRNPFAGNLMVPQTEYPALHQQFFNITINNNNYGTTKTSDPVITIPKLEVFDDLVLNKWVWEAIHYSFADDSGARIIHHLYQGQWVHSNQTWYVFQDHYWKAIPGDSKDESFPSTDVITLEVAGLLETVKNAYVANGHDDASIIKRIAGGIRGLKQTSGISSTITRCRALFKDDDFAKGLDLNGNLLGFTNGVYDLLKDEFWAGRQEDMISMMVGYPYKALAEDSDAVQVVHAWLDQVFPVAEEKHFVLKLLASCLSAVIREHKFWIWIGGGANGKSTLIDLMQETLGEYATDVASTLFTARSPPSTAATPQLVELVNKRFVASQEIQRNEQLNLETCKKLTGGDKIPGRALYKNNIHFKNKAKIMFCLNNLPSINAQDDGTWRRIVLIKFRSAFVDKPTKPNEFKINRKLRDTMVSWKLAMMAILLRYYQIYIDEGLEDVPKYFLEMTETYRFDNDDLGDFLETYCELGEGFQVTQADFVASYRRIHPRTDKGPVKEAMSQKFGRGIARNDKIEVGKRIDEKGVEKPKYERGWKGLRLRF